MGDLKLRTFIVAALLAVSLWLVGKPLLIDKKSPLTLGLDIRGGVNLRYQLDPKDVPPGTPMSDALAVTQEIFQNRLDSLAIKEISIRTIGDDQIEVAVPGITTAEADSITKTLESQGRLEFRLEAWTEAGVDFAGERTRLEEEITKRKAAGEEINDRTDFSALTQNIKLGGTGVTFRWVPKSSKALQDERAAATRTTRTAAGEPTWDTPDSWVLVRFDPREGQFFSGDQVQEVYPQQDSESGNMAVGFQIKAGRPAQQFADWTENNQGRSIVTLLDHQVQSKATIEGRIEGSGIIRGGGDTGFTTDELRRLISVIKSGSVPAKPVLVQKFTQGPTLGEASIQRSVQALLVCFAMVAGFMLVYYRLAGVVAVFALVCNLLLLVAAMAWLGATLTLPGMAGLILTIGMAVDANILINERIREEIEKGKTVAQAVKNGFDRAYVTIFDSNLTTFIAAFFLYQFGTGAIRGFAVSVMIGLATSMLTGVYFSRTFFAWLLRADLKRLPMMRLLSTPNLKFMKYGKACYLASAVFIVIGVGAFLLEDRKKYGMDFTGGFEVHVQLKEPTAQPEVLALASSKYTSPDVVSVEAREGKATRFQIKIKETDVAGGDSPAVDASDKSIADRFAAEVAALFGDRLVEPGIRGLELGEATPQGHVPVKAQLQFDGDVKKSDLEAALKREVNVESIEGSDVGSRFTVAGQFKRPPGSEEVARGLLSPKLKSPDGTRDVLLSDPMPAKSYVGPRSGKDLRDSAIRAMLFSILGIVVYARMRFSQYRYGIAAIVALIHDVLIALAAFGLTRLMGYELEIDLTVIAAFLTIIGYSVNDKIVVFDRVRENLPRSSLPLPDLIDRSVNQTMSRTVLTSLSVLSMVILFLFNLGQRNPLEAFSFAMIIGIVAGTYSSIYIASTLLAWLSARAESGTPKSPKVPPPPKVAV